MESCEVCGFVWELVTAGEVHPRVVAGSSEAGSLVAGHPAWALLRPADSTTWSPLEYAAHIRDVLLHVRDRLVLAVVEDGPTFKPLYRDERVDLGLYAGDDPEVVARELAMAAELFGRTFDRLTDEQLVRTVEYAYPTVAIRSVLWMGQQVVHEVEHHLADIEAQRTA